MGVRDFLPGGGGGGGGGAVNYLSKKFFQVAQIFTKKRKRGSYNALTMVTGRLLAQHLNSGLHYHSKLETPSRWIFLNRS